MYLIEALQIKCHVHTVIAVAPEKTHALKPAEGNNPRSKVKTSNGESRLLSLFIYFFTDS